MVEFNGTNYNEFIPNEYHELYTSDKFIYLLTGGRNSLKSFNVALYVMLATFSKGHKILYTRYTMTNAEKSIIPEFEEKMEIFNMRKYFRVVGHKIINISTGSLVYFSGIKTSSGNQTANLKGMKNLTMAVVDEAEEWQSEVDFVKLMGSIRNPNLPKSMFKFIIVMNPTTPDHFIYRRFILKYRSVKMFEGFEVEMSNYPNLLHIHTTYHKYKHLAPQHFIDEAEYRLDLHNKGIDHSNEYAHMYIGQWLHNLGGLMYKNISYYDELPKMGINYCFIDPADDGDDYFCAWFIRYAEGKIYVYDCIYTTEDMTVTLPILSMKCRELNVTRVWIEGNGIGAAFYKNLRDDYKLPGLRVHRNKLNKNFRIRRHSHLISWVNFKRVYEEDMVIGNKDEFVNALIDLRKTPYIFTKSQGNKLNLDSADCLNNALMHFLEKYPQIFKVENLINNDRE
jgi:phage terminase large subunit